MKIFDNCIIIYFFLVYETSFSFTEMDDDVSTPLRREDSDQSWKPPSQGSEDAEKTPPPDPNKMYLVSLARLMALFT
jgi:hypothetical protein